MNQASYTAASTIPSKLFADDEIVRSIREHRIRPLHAQVNPTNKCPLRCSYCSCANMDRQVEMPIGELVGIAKQLIHRGTKAFTITGGGDPLAYKDLGRYLSFLKDNGQHVGLVTNGVFFDKHDRGIFGNLDWCRISLSDERNLDPEEIAPTIDAAKIDWSFSYVLLRTLNLPNLINSINFANQYGFTHIRIVDDIIGSGKVSMDNIKKTLIEYDVDTSRVIWQGRKAYGHGHKRCLLSLLKPNIDVYGNMTGCCGVQYASEPPMLDFTRYFRICGPTGIDETYDKQKYFDGKNCQRCYYADYNNVLNAAWDSGNLKHQEFL